MTKERYDEIAKLVSEIITTDLSYGVFIHTKLEIIANLIERGINTKECNTFLEINDYLQES
jgi:hypothetical protein